MWILTDLKNRIMHRQQSVWKYADVLYSVFMILASMSLSSAFADGTLGEVNIRLSGTIVALECEVEPGDVDKTVVLGSWAPKQFKKPGDHTAYVPFTIHLTGCTANGVTVSFDGKKDSHDNNLLALSDDSSAAGVGIQIMDSSQKLIPVGEDSPQVLVDDNGDATLSFYASYVATDNTVSPGTANADTEFVLTYD
ncbi:adhesin [Erwinia endophytica]|uniref:fimbrial protein n=1 Tax=Erwinia endophytica TaxID=1563158 RepID=UPI0012660579|nr:fimbrial protein [Erwinia endophytica]KAB8312629.1 adhesin [Erwinia endophytica]